MMKKSILVVAVAVLLSSCGFLKNSTSGASSQTSNQQTAVSSQQNAMTSGQGAGNALLNLYNQYKADGNKYDYKNMQNALNTVTLLANCEGLKSNYKDKDYLKDFGKGMVASSLGLVTQNNVESVTNSLVNMVKDSETVQNTKSSVQEGASNAAGYVNTAAQYAGAISSLLSAFGGK